MSEVAATYRFLAWVRQGLAAAISGPPEPDGRARLPVKLRVERDGQGDTVEVALRFYGPGDVIGIDTAQIVRAEPKPYTTDFEANYFPLVEFAVAGYPWMFSPDGNAGQVRPWLCLVAVRRDRAQVRVDPSRPLPCLRLDPADVPRELPDPAEAWAWAHAQVAGTTATPQAALGGPAELTLSRLLCPRRLEARTAYVACLVPTFLAGRQAGLGEPVQPGTDLAWSLTAPGPAPFELPIYHHWEFTTGPPGDFEALARRVQPRQLGPDIGGRPMDLTEAHPELPVPQPDRPGSALALEGVLGPPLMEPGEWPAPAREPFQERLAQLLNDLPGEGPMAVPPPVYGSVQAGTDPARPLPDTTPRWLRDLNLDPRSRVAAALGVRVVQDLQEQLMASAWDQAGQLETANEMLREAQLARALGTALREKRLEGLPEDAVARLTEPVHARVRLRRDGTQSSGARTLRGSLRAPDSVFPEAAVSPTFRRLLRPQGPIGRRLPGSPGQPTSELTRELANGEVTVPLRPAKGGAAFDDVGEGLADPEEKPTLDKAKQRVPEVPEGEGWKDVSGRADAFYRHEDPYKPETGTETAQRQGAAAENGDGDGDGEWEPPTGLRRARLLGINRRFKEAADALLSALPPPPIPPSVPEPDNPGLLAVGAVADSLVGPQGLLEPERTMVRQVSDLVPTAPDDGGDPLRPRTAAITFPQAMSEPLKQLAPDMLLPGVEKISPESVAILTGNARFVEAYMVGLNHELSRELLWRGLPTPLGATFFRQFWDARGRGPVTADTTPTDIPPIEQWDADKALGRHATRVGGSGMLVLLIRSELLRRYPTTAIYAVRADSATGPDGQAVPLLSSHPPLYPEFRGHLEPDLTYLGFGIGVAEARGSETDPGWFFIIQEQPTAARFGLDLPPDDSAHPPPARWSALHWGHLVEPGPPPSAPSYALACGGLRGVRRPVLGDRDLPEAEWGADAGQMAAIAYQPPMRVAIHARALLGEVVDPSLQVTAVGRHQGVVTALAGVDRLGQGWQMAHHDAVDAVIRGEAAFYVEEDAGNRLKLVVAHRSDGGAFLKTEADGDWPERLLSLPDIGA